MQIPDIVNEIKGHRVRWVGHILCADPKRSLSAAMGHSVENDLASSGCLQQNEELARDRNRCSQIIDTVRASNGP